MQTKRLRGFVMASSFAILSLALTGASCDKKPATKPENPSANTAPSASDQTAPQVSALPGVRVSDLSGSQTKRLNKLADKMSSPCKKAHSLRTSLLEDKSCKRSTFAIRYLKTLVIDDLSADEIDDAYEGRYINDKTHAFKTDGAPYQGARDAPVVLVEFFDYGCGHCRLFTAVIDEILAEFPSDVVVYYKHYPLGSFPDSVPAAMAAIAAQQQGKFLEMHKALLRNQHSQSASDLMRYAKGIGLDMTTFTKAMTDPATRLAVTSDRAEGEKTDMGGTPTLFIDGRLYSDHMEFEPLADWIREQIAVNR